MITTGVQVPSSTLFTPSSVQGPFEPCAALEISLLLQVPFSPGLQRKLKCLKLISKKKGGWKQQEPV